MGLWRDVFGPPLEEVWGQLAQDVGGRLEGGFWSGHTVRYQYKTWEMLLDVYVVSNGKSSTSYTRIRAPFLNPSKFYFSIYRQGFFSEIGKFFGMQDIEIGDPAFDPAFIIKSNQPETIKTLLYSKEIKELMHRQPEITFESRDDQGLFWADYPEGVDELRFMTYGVIKDIDRLKLLFELFTTTLDTLVDLDLTSNAPIPRKEKT